LLIHARTKQHTKETHNVRADEIQSLARKLGDESLAEIPINEEVFCRLDFNQV